MNKRDIYINNVKFRDITNLNRFEWVSKEFINGIKCTSLIGVNGLYKTCSYDKQHAFNKWLEFFCNFDCIESRLKVMGNCCTFSIFVYMRFKDNTSCIYYITCNNNYFKRLS